MRRFNTVELTEKEQFKLKVMDAYRKMNKKNVRYLCVNSLVLVNQHFTDGETNTIHTDW